MHRVLCLMQSVRGPYKAFRRIAYPLPPQIDIPHIDAAKTFLRWIPVESQQKALGIQNMAMLPLESLIDEEGNSLLLIIQPSASVNFACGPKGMRDTARFIG